ncbi:hypothetical protein D3C83_267240 [compost metagenome]
MQALFDIGAANRISRDDPQAGEIAGRFRIVEELRVSDCLIVVEAEHADLRRQLVLALGRAEEKEPQRHRDHREE